MYSSFTDPNILASEEGTIDCLEFLWKFEGTLRPNQVLVNMFGATARNAGSESRMRTKSAGPTQKEMRPVNPDVSGLAGRDFRVGSGITGVTMQRLENRHSWPILCSGGAVLTGEIKSAARYDKENSRLRFRNQRHMKTQSTLSNT
ncbi:MAG TPA: hypothetical protein VGJ69_09960 [Pyrinomonadaceae bacterium]|jgi:hypothetical protein